MRARGIDYDLRAPLHAAAGEGNVHVIGFLLEQRADVNAVDHRGCTPLDEAVRTSHQLVAQRLREAGATMGESALPVELGRLARAGRLDQLEHLARYGGDMDAADEDGRTCLHLAAAYGHKHIVKFLANMGDGRVNLDALDLQGRSALVYATQQGHHHVVKYLQEVMKQPVEERARFSAAVTGEFDASPMKYVDDDAPRKPSTLMPFSSRRSLGRIDTNASPSPSRPAPPLAPSTPPLPPHQPMSRPPSDGQGGKGGKGVSPLGALQEEVQLSRPSTVTSSEASNAATEDAGAGPASERGPPAALQRKIASAEAGAAAAGTGGIEIDPALLDDDALFGMME